MDSYPNRLLLLGLIQDLQKKARDAGLSRTAAALVVTGQVAAEELSDLSAPSAPGGLPLPGADEQETAAD